MPFSKLELKEEITKLLYENSYKKPTAIQEKVIPLVLKKNDIIAKAQTGSGKTASFVLPILQLYSKKEYKGKAKIRALVLTPTRELALQVSQTFTIFSQNLQRVPKLVTVIGGESIGEQLLDIQKGCDIVVATTGRLIDILEKKQLNLSTLEFFVLDEADKMLDLGFEEQLDLLLKELPLNRQNLLFSATYPKTMEEITKKITNKAIEVFIKDESSTVENIKQRVIEVNKENRSELLRKLIKDNSWDLILVFMASKRSCDNIASKFRKYGLNADSFHGDYIQNERNDILQEFKEKKIKILFATDIAARGLHIDNISCVVNYDLPRSASDYIHRIGRTGRAGKIGTSISFVGLEDFEHISLIEKKCELKFEKEQIKGFELLGKPLKKQKGKEPVKGARMSKKDKLRQKALKD